MAKVIAQELGMSQAQIQQVTQRVFSEIVEMLVQKGCINLPPVGVFEIKKSKSRPARNPRTGEKVLVPGRAIVTFKLDRDMEERVRQSDQGYYLHRA
jgi:nucleoid DNA-binding protein